MITNLLNPTHNKIVKATTMHKQTLGILGAILLICVISIGFGVTLYSVLLPTSGNISSNASIGLYSDPACNIPLINIDWSTVNASETVSEIVYVKNNGNVPVTLDMNTDNYLPAQATQYLTVTWNYDGSVLLISEVKAATIQLSVSPSAPAVTFSFNIYIIGEA